LNFDGTCREAMTLYKDCPGADLQLTPFMDEKGQPLKDPAARGLHSMILVGGKLVLQASDAQPGDRITVGDNVQVARLQNGGGDRRLFAAFSKDARIRLPLGTMFWGARFGMLTDRYGVLRMFNCQLNQ
jgi:PhnB protein